MKKFFKPTKVTWIMFMPFAAVTVAPLLLIGLIGVLWSFDPGGPQQSIINVLNALYPFIVLGIVEYLIASLISFLWYKRKSKQSQMSNHDKFLKF
jgi:uncharacterized membrane protein YqjE